MRRRWLTQAVDSQATTEELGSSEAGVSTSVQYGWTSESDGSSMPHCLEDD